MHKWLPIFVALIVHDAALRYCIAQALEPQPPLPAWFVEPHGPIDALHLAITVPDSRRDRHLDPCLAESPK
jgi:hypothetical protein